MSKQSKRYRSLSAKLTITIMRCTSHLPSYQIFTFLRKKIGHGFATLLKSQNKMHFHKIKNKKINTVLLWGHGGTLVSDVASQREGPIIVCWTILCGVSVG